MKCHNREKGRSEKSIPTFSRHMNKRFSVGSNLKVDTELLIPGMRNTEQKSSKNFKLLSNHPAFKGLKSCTPKSGSRLNGFLASGNDIRLAIKTTRSKLTSISIQIWH